MFLCVSSHMFDGNLVSYTSIDEFLWRRSSKAACRTHSLRRASLRPARVFASKMPLEVLLWTILKRLTIDLPQWDRKWRISSPFVKEQT